MQDHHAIYCDYCHMVFSPIKTWSANQGFLDEYELVDMIYNHITDHFYTQTLFQCHKCPLSFLTSRALMEHISKHNSKILIQPYYDTFPKNWRNGSGIGDYPEPGLKKVFQTIPTVILSKTNRANITSLTMPSLNVVMEKGRVSTYLKYCTRTQRSKRATIVIREQEKRIKFENPSSKFFLDFRQVFCFSDILGEVKKVDVARQEDDSFRVPIICSECGQFVGAQKHFLSELRNCENEDCRYQTSCIIALSTHNIHCQPNVTFRREQLTRGRIMKLALLPEWEQTFIDTLDLENDKILVCRVCNFIGKNLGESGKFFCRTLIKFY